jgi:hypothetical protein
MSLMVLSKLHDILQKPRQSKVTVIESRPVYSNGVFKKIANLSNYGKNYKIQVSKI